MGTARDEAVSQIEAYLRRTLLAMDAGEHWVTVNAGSKTGGEGGGSHVMLDGEGRVVAGMGGKFRGTKVDDIPRKKFINEKAYQRKTEREAQEAKAKAMAPKTASRSKKAAEPKPAFTPSQPMHPALKRNDDGSLSVKFDGYPGREVLDKIKAKGFKYDGDTKTWTLSKRKATDDAVEAVNNELHTLKPVRQTAPSRPQPQAPKPAQAPAVQTARTSAAPAQSKPVSKGEPVTIPDQNKALTLTRNADGSTEMSVNFGGYPGREVISSLKSEGFRYDGDTQTWTKTSLLSGDPGRVNEILEQHSKPKVSASVSPATVKSLTDAGMRESQYQRGSYYLPRASYNDPAAADPAFKDLFGLEVSRYGTGNISSARLDGQPISNSRAKHLIGMSTAASFNTATGKWSGLDPELQAIWEKRNKAQS